MRLRCASHKVVSRLLGPMPMNLSRGSRLFGSVLLSTVLLAGCNERRATSELSRVVPTIRVVSRAEAPRSPVVERDVSNAAVVPASTSKTVSATADRRAARGDEPRSAAAHPGASGEPQVKRLVIARDVDRKARKPEGVAGSFSLGDFEKLYAFVEVDSRDGDSEIHVSFDPPGGAAPKGSIPLKVGESPRFRTWASTRAIDKRGVWTAIVTDASGHELARESFLVM